jgi:hypothetical protein
MVLSSSLKRGAVFRILVVAPWGRKRVFKVHVTDIYFSTKLDKIGHIFTQ